MGSALFWAVQGADEQGEPGERRQRDQDVEDVGHASFVRPVLAGQSGS